MSTYSHPRTYNHSVLEAKWSNYWKKTAAFETPTIQNNIHKEYILDMFPYPSGAGLHVGHILGYTGSDVIARVARKHGKSVLHPMGWDAFGLPAENFALKSGIHPSISTAENISNFKKQFSAAGFSYDWAKEINTSDPEYYRWTQWLFGVLYRRGLAYQKQGAVNWCPKDQTVLANEQVVGGACERCGTLVVQREMKQWYFKITEYSEELLKCLDELDWPEKIKSMQRNWIGRSDGAEFTFNSLKNEIPVFTTRPDTLEGVTFLAMAPEHPLVKILTTSEQKLEVDQYVAESSRSSERERTFTDRPKTGVFTGSFAINPLDGRPVPVWIADYVLCTYGTGAVMGVPAHDKRDFDFAEMYALEIKQVVGPTGAVLPYLGKGERQDMEKIVKRASGIWKTTYRLRDWLVSRQRYWGVPIPILYGPDGSVELVQDSLLPVILPTDVDFVPTGRSPLETASAWKEVTTPSGSVYQRETDTLDTFVCSSWYYLRFPTPKLVTAAFDPEALREWLPVDTYVGGAEHAVLHLLYARFITKVLADEGLLEFREPFTKLINQGIILGPDHQKMSKSKGNVISPDQVISDVGADVLRMYELFMAPFDTEKPWDTKGISGVRRFLERVWRMQPRATAVDATTEEEVVLNRLVTSVSGHLDSNRFNVAIAAFMEAINSFDRMPIIAKGTYSTLLNILNPFAPFVTEELWEISEFSGTCMEQAWPTISSVKLALELVTVVIQVNGKVRGKVLVGSGEKEENVLREALALSAVATAIGSSTVTKQIFISNKLLSLVVEAP